MKKTVYKKQQEVEQLIMFMVILCSCPNNETATTIATSIIENQLAACVNIIPGVESIYSWQRKIENSHEHLLLIKTTADLYNKLEKVIKQNHPYECPEIIALPIQQGAKEYLEWIRKVVRNFPH